MATKRELLARIEELEHENGLLREIEFCYRRMEYLPAEMEGEHEELIQQEFDVWNRKLEGLLSDYADWRESYSPFKDGPPSSVALAAEVNAERDFEVATRAVCYVAIVMLVALIVAGAILAYRARF